MRRAVMVSAATAALVVGAVPLAAAAPPERETILLECDDGETYEVEVPGQGEFTPGRVVGTNQVLVPISFGETTITADPPGAPPPVVITEPGAEKGGGNVRARNPQETVTCDFTFSFVLTEPDEDLPAGTAVTIAGSVTGFLTGP